MGDKQPAGRVDWVDAAKGLGIIAVVAGHVWYRGPLRDAIYLFHMPLFFILAGWFFRPRPMAETARKQLVAMGVPYLVFLLLIYSFDQWFETMRGHRPWLTGWEGLGRLAMGGSALTGPFTIFWFPPCLLAARLAQNAIGLKLEDPLRAGWVTIATVSLLLGLVAGWATDFSPLGLLAAPVALFLLWLGHALKAGGHPVWLGWAALPLGVAALAFCPPVNMKMGDYGWPILSLAGGIAVCLLVFRAAMRLSWFASLGAMSLVIMYVHVPIVHYGGPFLPKWALFVLALGVPYAAGLLARRHRLTAFLFLGKPLRS